MTVRVRYSPFRTLALGVLAIMIVGAVLLALPFSARTEEPFLDHLFMAVSAVSTTGLATLSVGSTYTFLGQLILLLLIQVGGWGFMTVTSFFLVARQRQLPASKEQVLRASYALPTEFNLSQFLKNTVVFTLAIEFLGSLVLGLRFMSLGRPDALWSGIFHSVSAFATAGFSLYDDSLTQFAHDPIVTTTISVLSLLGAIGFLVLQDFWLAIRQKRRLTFTTVVILSATASILVIGIPLFWLADPGLLQLPWPEALSNAAFQVISASTTAGFNTVDIGSISRAALFILVLVMVVGASPSGTGGGVKTTTISALVGVVMSLVRQRKSVSLWGNVIPLPRILTAIATLVLYLFVMALGILALCLVEPLSFEKLAFEATSALGTVGLSTGITTQLHDGGRAVLIVLMYVGRLGPLSFGISLLGSTTAKKGSRPQEDLVV